jgi:hypothetical protein
LIILLRLASLFAILLMGTSLAAMTVDIPAAGLELIEVGDEWSFFRGTKAPSDPPDAWKEVDSDDSGWESGPSGFGYGDNDDATLLNDMEGSYVSVYIRKELIVLSPPDGGVLQLVIDYDDGFIAYLNGGLAASRHMPDEPPTFETEATNHEAGTPETISLGEASDLLRDGKNVLAIEGHNHGKDSSDFSLTLSLRIATDIVKDGETWIVGTGTITVSGAAPVPQTTSVTVNETTANLNPADGTWEGEITLSPGVNLVYAEALDADGAAVDTGTTQIVYIPPERRLGNRPDGPRLEVRDRRSSFRRKFSDAKVGCENWQGVSCSDQHRSAELGGNSDHPPGRRTPRGVAG